MPMSGNENRRSTHGRYDDYDYDDDDFDHSDDKIEYFNLTEIVFDEGFGPDGEPISSDEESDDPTERKSPGAVLSTCTGDDNTVMTSGNIHPHNPQRITNNAPIPDFVQVTHQLPSSDISLGDSSSVIEERWGSVHEEHCEERRGKDVLLEEERRGEEESSLNATNRQTTTVEVNCCETSQIDSESVVESKGEELTPRQVRLISAFNEGSEQRYYGLTSEKGEEFVPTNFTRTLSPSHSAQRYYGVTRSNKIFTRTEYFQHSTYAEVKCNDEREIVRRRQKASIEAAKPVAARTRSRTLARRRRQTSVRLSSVSSSQEPPVRSIVDLTEDPEETDDKD